MALTDDGGDAVALRAVWVAEAGEVEVDFVSDLPAERVERHAARVLSLDVDATGLAEVGGRDPVVGRLLAEAGGRRPVCFGTPFEAAVWAVLSQRVSMAQARRVKDALAAALGTRMEIGGEEVLAFPGPAALVGLDEFLRGVWASKLERIRALAALAAGGRPRPGLPALARPRRRDHPPRVAPGHRPLRSDARPRARSRPPGRPTPDPPPLPRGGRAPPTASTRSRTTAKLAELSEAWRPYRAWVTWLLRSVDSR